MSGPIVPTRDVYCLQKTIPSGDGFLKKATEPLRVFDSIAADDVSASAFLSRGRQLHGQMAFHQTYSMLYEKYTTSAKNSNQMHAAPPNSVLVLDNRRACD
jgi:hypothetical protein